MESWQKLDTVIERVLKEITKKMEEGKPISGSEKGLTTEKGDGYEK